MVHGDHRAFVSLVLLIPEPQLTAVVTSVTLHWCLSLPESNLTGFFFLSPIHDLMVHKANIYFLSVRLYLSFTVHLLSTIYKPITYQSSIIYHLAITYYNESFSVLAARSSILTPETSY